MKYSVRTRVLFTLAIGSLWYGGAVAPGAQTTAGTTFTSSSNAFLTDSRGKLYLIWSDVTNQTSGLYTRVSTSSDGWDRVAGGTRSLAIDPSNVDVMYSITTDFRTFKTLDGAKTWLPLSGGLPDGNRLCVTVNPHDAGRVYIGTASGLFKSADGGFSWTPTAMRDRVEQVFVGLKGPDSVFVRSGRSGLSESLDDGTTWKHFEKSLPTTVVSTGGRTAKTVPVQVTFFLPVVRDSLLLFAGTREKGLLLSADGGNTWKPCDLQPPPPELHSGGGFANKETILIAVGKTVYRSSDGRTWTRVAIDPIQYARGMWADVGSDGFFVVEDCCPPANAGGPRPSRWNIYQGRRIGEVPPVSVNAPRLAYVKYAGGVVPLNYGILAHSDVIGAWAGQFNGRPTVFASVVNDWFIDFARSEHVLMYSSDQGASWERLAQYLAREKRYDPVISLSPINDKELWISDTEKGYVDELRLRTMTVDGGNTWRTPPFEFRRVVFDPAQPGLLYTGQQRVNWSNRATDPQATTLSNPVTAVDKNNSKRLLSYGNQPTDWDQNALGWSLSTDAGWTWKRIQFKLPENIPRVRYTDPTVLSFDNGAMLAYRTANEQYGPRFTQLVKSTDDGVSWMQVGQLNDSCFQLRIDPSNENHLVGLVSVNDRDTSVIGARLLETHDQGRTWAVAREWKDLPDNMGLRPVNDFLIPPEPRDFDLVVATKAGLLLRRRDGSWLTPGGLTKRP